MLACMCVCVLPAPRAEDMRLTGQSMSNAIQHRTCTCSSARRLLTLSPVIIRDGIKVRKRVVWHPTALQWDGSCEAGAMYAC